MYSILTFFVDSFEWNSVLMAEGSVLGVLRVTSLVIIGGSPITVSWGGERGSQLPYILESNPHPFYSFRGPKNHMWIRIACGLDSQS